VRTSVSRWCQSIEGMSSTCSTRPSDWCHRGRRLNCFRHAAHWGAAATT